MSLARDIADLGSVTSRLDTVGASTGSLSNRNLIINGGMQCWQRATSATAAANNYTTVDRYQMYEATDGAYTTQQSTGNAADTGHDTALQANVTTADGSIAAGQYAAILHKIEAQNLQHLQWGTAAGKNLVLSFWVKSNKTGIYSLSTEKTDSTTYRRVNEFTINSANTWEQKTIKIPALTNSNSNGTIANDNGFGIKFEWCLAYGSTFSTSSLDQWITTSHFASTNQVNWMDSTSNNFYLTGVQLEVGDTATDFEHRTFGDELARCERYLFRTYEYGTTAGTAGRTSCIGRYVDGTQNYAAVQVPHNKMRAVPTVVVYSTSDGATGNLESDGGNKAVATQNIGSSAGGFINVNNSSVSTSQGIRCHVTLDAEL